MSGLAEKYAIACTREGCGCREKIAQTLADDTGSVFYRGKKQDGMWVTSNDRDLMIRECPEFTGFVPKQNQTKSLLQDFLKDSNLDPEPDPNPGDPDEIVQVTRVLVYVGQRDWLDQTLKFSQAIQPDRPYVCQYGEIKEVWRG